MSSQILLGSRPTYRRRRRVVAIVAALAISLPAAGCSDGGARADSDDTFVYLSSRGLVTEWDPARSYSDEVVALSNTYETLTRYNAGSGKTEGVLATRWTSSKDRRTWTFTLRDNVRFHSGRPLTAQAVKASIDRTMRLKASASYVWDPVRSITPIGKRKVRFELSRPAQLDIIASATYAAWIYEVSDAKDYYKANARGTGPYMVTSWNPSSENEVQLTAFKDYWGGWRTNQYKNVVFQAVPQASTEAQLMRSGEGTYTGGMPPQLLDTLRGRPDLRVYERPSWQTLIGLMNTQKKPLDDIRVRQAVANALDYQELVKASRGALVASDGVIPKGMFGHTTTLDLPGDQDRARKLLKEAGYGPGSGRTITLEMTYPAGEDTVRTLGDLMKAQLRPFGIDLKVEGLAWASAQWPRAKKKNVNERQDIFVMWWWPDDPEPLSYFRNVFRTEKEISYNLAYYSNPELDRLIDSVGALTATDPDDAVRTYRTMQEIIIRDAPQLFLGTNTYQRVLAGDVKGFVDNPAYANVVFVHDLTHH
ncbi:ABC transporter substrate-binding protein [Streptomyces longispororuber]|uniref:ABC transporter substrate-binding protein n=1 Tax=Streptomyces longispororuber TaxID=68230 RepID=UPI00210CA19B|nr:ABC transporter substrate-binding protein [Streptomyces longispororuber]MCQ4210948.1 ABC transporter substrate-binding protein [Streptomyces longispororuber]